MLEDGYYTICPKCLEIVEEWDVARRAVINETAWPSRDTSIIEYERDKEQTEYIEIVHEGCEWLINVFPEDLQIKVEKGVIVNIGFYWIEHPEELKKVLQKFGLAIQEKLAKAISI